MIDQELLEYRREFCRLRYEFFKRAPEPSGECLEPEICQQPGAVLCDNCQAWAEWEVRGASYRRSAENPDDGTAVELGDPANFRDFTLRVNTRLPLSEIKKELARQVTEIEQQIKAWQCHMMTAGGIVRDYHPKNRRGAKDTLVYWRRCLDVYDRRQEGDSWDDIGWCLHGKYQKDRERSVDRPKGSVTRDARNDHNEAIRLITSAAAGTFPD